MSRAKTDTATLSAAVSEVPSPRTNVSRGILPALGDVAAKFAEGVILNAQNADKAREGDALMSKAFAKGWALWGGAAMSGGRMLAFLDAMRKALVAQPGCSEPGAKPGTRKLSGTVATRFSQLSTIAKEADHIVQQWHDGRYGEAAEVAGETLESATLALTYKALRPGKKSAPSPAAIAKAFREGLYAEKYPTIEALFDAIAAELVSTTAPEVEAEVEAE